MKFDMLAQASIYFCVLNLSLIINGVGT